MNEFNQNNRYNQDEVERQFMQDVSGLNAYLSRVFMWMFAGLGLTFAVSYYVSHSYKLLSYIFSNRYIPIGLMLAEFALVFVLTANIEKFSVNLSRMIFIFYSALTGLTFSVIFIVYDIGTITNAFISASALFAGMAIYGKVTKRDLSGWSGFLTMGLIGIIIASIINMFMRSSMAEFVISVISIIVFSGLTAYDMNKLKNWYYSSKHSNEALAKIAILGALELYLDFINLFLSLLRLFGNSRD